jgi:hypothetical protein
MTPTSAKQAVALDKQVAALDLGSMLQPQIWAQTGLNLGFGFFLFLQIDFFLSIRLSNQDYK